MIREELLLAASQVKVLQVFPSICIKTYIRKLGSSGTAVIILNGKAALWTDSRYYIQAKNQLDEEYWILMKSG